MNTPLRDHALEWSLRFLTTRAALIVLLIVAFVGLGSAPALHSHSPWAFFGAAGWRPTQGEFGLLAMLAGSASLAFGAVLLGTPLAFGAALFVHFHASPRLAGAFRRLIELLSGVPSVVWGFWGLVALVPLIRGIEPPGASLLAGSCVLALMIVPTIALFADAAIAAVPRAYLQGAASLGLSRWGTVHGIVLPAARSGLATGVLMGLARALGETMAVLMVAGNVVQMPDSIFAPVRALTANIALEMAYATQSHRSVLFVSGLVLLIIVIALVGGAELLGRRGRAHGV